ncbi:N(4)-(beta-N-acetylglucosaminyl)-L-asparaginase [Lewinella sp. IMCC34191]|uniref:N(4)-(beta-N-acetylglucosaminyl)-L-asparaginase n=1 Tax=Lewinella sp. IMCC34191 TaxID=2259172 RepID=UPI000E282C74|nr:N(4)-(beta-N-acetylglucosaminyl)-L-asparaginase [Lewinella sp. IMCC34191]
MNHPRGTRRRFLQQVPLLAATPLLNAKLDSTAIPAARSGGPVVISTWRHGLSANEEAWKVLADGGNALDAAEAGVRITESDPEVRTVGLGGFPDRDGIVTLDAAIMDGSGDCGSVAALEDIMHPISVARRVMTETPHVMLVGAGARQFAVAQGFAPTELLTEASRRDYEKWLEEDGSYRPPINVENHDTIGLLTLDKDGNIAAACTTSGAAYKYHGRVGDSPIIGAGLYADNEVGAATATGWGEAVIRACGSFLVVELMRQGHDPTEACKLAVERVIAKNPDWKDIQVGFIALHKDGRTGGYCIHPDFDYAVYDGEGNRMVLPDSKVPRNE